MSSAIADLLEDLRITFRGLRRAPGLALTIIITVGLGIAATSGIFAVMDAVLLRPLPYAQPEQLVRIFTDAPPYRFRFSVADYLALETQQTTFTSVAAFADRSMAYTDGTVAERLRGRQVTWRYFELLGLTPAIGRRFIAAEGMPGGPPAVIVSHSFWRLRLAGSTTVLGQPLRLDGLDYNLVGVLPPRVGPLERGQDFFIVAQWETPRRKGPFLITVLGRLSGDDGLGAASSELRAINRRIFPLWQASYQDQKATWGAMDLKASLVGGFRTVARLAIVAVTLVWFIACVNASNLLVARVTSRRREVAVRSALGASRARVVRYLLAESVVLSTIAVLVGGAIAGLGVQIVRTSGANYIPRADEVVLGGRTLLVMIGIASVSALIFGLVPALYGTGGPVEEGLRTGSRSSTGNRSVRRLRALLVGGQFAIATPLLVVAALLLLTLRHLSRVELGFDTTNVLSGSISLPTSQYRDDAQVMSYWERARSAALQVPGVIGVAYADSRPPSDAGNQNNFDLEDSPTLPGESQAVTTWVDVTPAYFDLFQLRAVEGRLLDDRDTATTAPSVVVVDQAWARRFFPGQSAVGKRLKSGGCSTCDWTTVVGVVPVVKYDGLSAPDQGLVYTPMAQRGKGLADAFSARSRYLVLRTGAGVETVLPQLRRVLRDLDPTLPFSRVMTVNEMVDDSLEQPRGLSMLLGALAFVALVLSVVGIYGVMAHYVHQQAREMSIRLALGAPPSSVWAFTVTRGMKLVTWGIAFGAIAAFALANLMSSLFFEVTPGEPATYAGVVGVMLAVSLAACGVPAARAASLEPSVVLRQE